LLESAREGEEVCSKNWERGKKGGVGGYLGKERGSKVVLRLWTDVRRDGGVHMGFLGRESRRKGAREKERKKHKIGEGGGGSQRTYSQMYLVSVWEPEGATLG